MPGFELLLFSTDPAAISQAVTAGVDGFVVDWECEGKEARQAGADTQINHDTLEDLRRVRASTEARVVCRINGYSEATNREIEDAIGAGADEILLPMVRRLEHVEVVLKRVGARCGVGILIETLEAVDLAEELSQLPLSRVYVGLNDLGIERGTPNIFSAVADGLVERIRLPFRVPFGFGGLTLPERGCPIPCRLLIGEMTRVRCDFSFLRRSWHRDMRGHDPAVEIPRLREALAEALRRGPTSVAQDQRELNAAIGESKAMATAEIREMSSHGRSPH